MRGYASIDGRPISREDASAYKPSPSATLSPPSQAPSYLATSLTWMWKYVVKRVFGIIIYTDNRYLEPKTQRIRDDQMKTMG